MKKNFTNLKKHIRKRNSSYRSIKGCLLSPIYWGLAHAVHTPGLFIHSKSFLLGFKLGFKGGTLNHSYNLMFSPMDSVRYFELEFIWKKIQSYSSLGRILDISSPRLFTLILLNDYKYLNIDAINPDSNDLLITKSYLDELKMNKRCFLHHCLLEKSPFKS